MHGGDGYSHPYNPHTTIASVPTHIPYNPDGTEGNNVRLTKHTITVGEHSLTPFRDSLPGVS